MSMDLDREWAYWQRFYDRERGLNVTDQPESSYFAFDVTDTELSNSRRPHDYYGFRSFGVPELLGLAVFVVFGSSLVYAWMTA
jgi:hypothetical protein